MCFTLVLPYYAAGLPPGGSGDTGDTYSSICRDTIGTRRDSGVGVELNHDFAISRPQTKQQHTGNQPSNHPPIHPTNYEPG